MAIDRVLGIVMDGVGCGALPDAKSYGDVGAHTLQHIAQHQSGLNLPHFSKLGLGKIDDIPGVSQPTEVVGSYGKLSEVSAGKDTATGHWELAGIHLKEAFPTFPDGFPKELVQALF